MDYPLVYIGGEAMDTMEVLTLVLVILALLTYVDRRK